MPIFNNIEESTHCGLVVSCFRCDNNSPTHSFFKYSLASGISDGGNWDSPFVRAIKSIIYSCRSTMETLNDTNNTKICINYSNLNLQVFITFDSFVSLLVRLQNDSLVSGPLTICKKNK